KQGFALAAAAADLGARVTLVTGPVTLADPPGVTTVRVESADEMLAAVTGLLPADIGIFAAAVADWRVARSADEKIKKDPKAGVPRLDLVENPDILKTIAHLKPGRRPALIIGFAAETENVIEHAKRKRKSKGCDWIVANDVSPETGVMGGDRNTVHVITASGVDSWPELNKDSVAERLIAAAAEEIGRLTDKA
ncbi:MAG TPA: phosphopantothenoylcysteine decarboxylase, partial [Hyphomicrobiaceae bacterium]|nr:phosphopantothenoylcysteine decarboxylase [Hyphomicrobiaceae bacterium]